MEPQRLPPVEYIPASSVWTSSPLHPCQQPSGGASASHHTPPSSAQARAAQSASARGITKPYCGSVMKCSAAKVHSCMDVLQHNNYWKDAARRPCTWHAEEPDMLINSCFKAPGAEQCCRKRSRASACPMALQIERFSTISHIHGDQGAVGPLGCALQGVGRPKTSTSACHCCRMPPGQTMSVLAGLSCVLAAPASGAAPSLLSSACVRSCLPADPPRQE